MYTVNKIFCLNVEYSNNMQTFYVLQPTIVAFIKSWTRLKFIVIKYSFFSNPD